MPGRRAFPYSVEAEEQAAPLPGRRKLKWRDRPRHFNTLDAAGTFAAKRAAATGRRQHVQLKPSPFGLMFTVRERDLTDLGNRMAADELRFAQEVRRVLDRQLVTALNRMEREA